MQVQTLRYFMELAQRGSFYAAAKSLHITQQGLNKAITGLESELGCTLLERSRRGVRLTRSGEIALRRVASIVSECDALENELVEQQMADAPDGKPVSVHVSYYSAQIAASDPSYVRLVAEGSSYIEEPFNKLVARATASDGSDLVFVDLHAHSMGRVLENNEVVFDPVIKTRVGFVWKEGLSPAAGPFLHRSEVSRMPVALNTHGEMAQLAEWLFRDNPLENVRLGTSSPRMLLEYAQSYDAVAIFDSFGFFLSSKDPDMPTEGLRFMPLSTPESICLVGFLYPKGVRPNLRARRTIGILKDFLAENCGEYFDAYPIGS